jgi:hypothetical protein
LASRASPDVTPRAVLVILHTATQSTGNGGQKNPFNMLD